MREKINEIPKEAKGKIDRQFDNNLMKLKRVKPTNTLFFLPGTPMACEKQAAEIRNRTVNSIEENDIRSVAYRYLQNTSGHQTTRNEALFFGTFSFSAVCFFMFFLPHYLVVSTLSKECIQEEELNKMIQLMQFILLIPSFLCMVLFLNVPPNICNTLRYRETKDFCDAWLTQKLGKEDFQQIENLSYNREAFFKINELMDKKNIPSALTQNVPSHYKVI